MSPLVKKNTKTNRERCFERCGAGGYREERHEADGCRAEVYPRQGPAFTGKVVVGVFRWALAVDFGGFSLPFVFFWGAVSAVSQVFCCGKLFSRSFLTAKKALMISGAAFVRTKRLVRREDVVHRDLKAENILAARCFLWESNGSYGLLWGFLLVSWVKSKRTELPEGVFVFFLFWWPTAFVLALLVKVIRWFGLKKGGGAWGAKMSKT